jgi:hypothetical protein
MFLRLEPDRRVPRCRSSLCPLSWCPSGKEAQTQRQHAQARSAWTPASQPAWLTVQVYLRKIQLSLARMSSSAIASRIGVSRWYAGSDSQRLPSSSETLGGAGGTGWSFGRGSLSNRDSSTAIPQKGKSAALEKRFDSALIPCSIPGCSGGDSQRRAAAALRAIRL